MIRTFAICCTSTLLAFSTAVASAEDLVGKAAPSFELKGVDGKTYKLDDYKGKIVVLEWANKDCPVWRGVLDELNATYEKYATNQISETTDVKKPEIIWLAVDSTNNLNANDVTDFCKTNKITRPVLDDSEGKVGQSFKARTTPHMFIINTDGKVVYDGAIDNKKKGDEHVNYVAKALDELKAGKDVSEAST
ncbi:MAG: redoxin domain-containing protein, partial [Phycisphaerae bacterium]